MKRNVWSSLLVVIIAAVVLAGCGSGGSNSSDTGDSGTSNDTGDEKTLTIAHGSDIVGFDIHDHGNTSTEAVHVNMFSYIIKNDNGDFKPDLATDWELVEDTIWEFNMRDDAIFHNGDNVTAEDVKFSLERVSRDETLSDYSSYRMISEVEVVDEYTFRIHTDEPTPTLLNVISQSGSGMGILPKNYIDENDWDHFLENPIGSGPYVFEEWIKDDRVVLKKFDDYFVEDFSEWDTLVFRNIPEASTRVAEALTGGVDIANNIPTADWSRVEENDGTYLANSPTHRVMMFYVRTNEGYPTADKKVRQAIDLAINNQQILDSVMDGYGTPTKTRLTPGNFGLDEDLYDTYDYDVEKAKQLLAEAGYEDGFEMTINSPNGRYLQDKETVQVVAGMLSEIGIDVKMEFMEWTAFLEMRNSNSHEDMYLLGLSASFLDGSQPLRNYGSLLSEEHIGYKNEEIDELLEVAATSMDYDLREENYKKVQEIGAEELPHIMLYQLDNFYAVNDKINFEPRADEMWGIENITSK